MKKYSRRLHVIENRPLSPDVFVLTLGLEAPDVDFLKIKPGQFANLLIEHADGVFLRRPFSIYDVDATHRLLKFYIQKKGKGSRKLANLTSKDSVEVVFPLGNGFKLIEKETFAEKDAKSPNVLLVGGGCGIAPLLFLAKVLAQKNIRPTILIGGRSRPHILEIENYVKYGKVLVITEDGSIGEKGLVTQHSIFQQEKFDQIYCCGPDAMMKAVAKIAIEKNSACQISLENSMACGIGACLCCVTQTKTGHQCVCTDGPVFDIRNLKMED